MGEYKDLLKNYNQEHLLKYIEKLDENNKEQFISQIENIDFEKMKELYSISKDNIGEKIKKAHIENLPFVDKYKIDDEIEPLVKAFGMQVIKNNWYAVVTMAGGQGTRLGHSGPKGTFLLDVKPKPKYLFEIIAEYLIKKNEEYGIVLNWYIMTSSENNRETVTFFEKHNYFGYPKDSIKFFIQGNLPLISEDGKLLVDENHNIKIAADGNGCVYKAMKDSGIIDDMKLKGIKWVFIGAVDNAILEMVDPYLVGLTIYEGNEIASRTIPKAYPEEKVGVFCKKDGVPSVIEYSEILEDMIYKKDEKGELLFGESHIMCNLYSIEAIERIANEKLPYHSAHKKANYIDENGKLVVATEPNAYKYEAFIFDGFKFFDSITLLRGKREEDFAPIKNKEGVDSPESAIKLYNNKYNS